MPINSQQITWREVNGNPFVRRLSPLMLEGEGQKIHANCTLKNDPKGVEKRLYTIIYDRDYAIQRVVNDLLRPLNFKSFNDFQQFISDCWKEYKKQSKGA